MDESLKNIAQQIKKLIDEKENILLVTHAKMDCDALSSTIALYLILQKMGKNVTAICQDPVPEAFKFLPDTDLMNTGFSDTSDFIITLDVTKTKLDSLKWNVEGNKVNIILSPEGEDRFSHKNFSFRGGSGKDFDLIISCDAGDVEQLGALYEENAEMFHSLPMIVIDHHASNEGFGTVNYIAPTNASTTETLYDLIPTITGKKYKFIDEDIATLLLAGIITDTGSFQHPNTTPKSFEVAAELIDMHARQQEIIRHLFKTKKLTTLRLWGRVLSKIKYDPVHRMVWSTVTREDLSDENASSDETEGLIDELMSNAPGAEVVLLLKEREDGVVSGSLRTKTPMCDATQIAGMFGGGGHRQAAGFKIRNPKSFEHVISEVVPKVEKFQEQRLGISTEDKSGSDTLRELKKHAELEKKSDFGPDATLPTVPEKSEVHLEKISDFEKVIPEKAQEKNIDSDIPEWLAQKPSFQEITSDQEEIPEWLEEADQAKQQGKDAEELNRIESQKSSTPMLSEVPEVSLEKNSSQKKNEEVASKISSSQEPLVRKKKQQQVPKAETIENFDQKEAQKQSSDDLQELAIPSSGETEVKPEISTPQKSENTEPPLANILDPNPPPDLIPQAPKVSPAPAPSGGQYPGSSFPSGQVPVQTGSGYIPPAGAPQYGQGQQGTGQTGQGYIPPPLPGSGQTSQNGTPFPPPPYYPQYPPYPPQTPLPPSSGHPPPPA